MTKYTVYKSIRKAIIYKIVCNKTGLVYVGSTARTLKQRVNEHKCMVDRCVSRTIIKNGDFEVVELEHFYTKFIFAILLKEQWYQDNIECINDRRAIPSYKQIKKRQTKYRLENQQDIYKKHNARYHKNDELRKRIREKQKIYNDGRKEKKAITDKKYREKNREYILQQKKQYYDWINSMGGDYRYNNNITRIDMTLFD